MGHSGARQIDVTNAGTYTVTITSGGCALTSSKVITGVGELLIVNIAGETELTCEQPASTLSAVTNWGDGLTYQ